VCIEKGGYRQKKIHYVMRLFISIYIIIIYYANCRDY